VGYNVAGAAAAEPLDARSDLFGVASVLYELAALDTLFREGADDIKALMARRRSRAASERAHRAATGRSHRSSVRALQRIRSAVPDCARVGKR
jgi:hypothetical protein